MTNVSMLSLRENSFGSGMLRECAVERSKEIWEFINARWREGSGGSRRESHAIIDCMDKLSMVLIQACRIKAYHDLLIQAATLQRDHATLHFGPGPYLAAYRGAETCGDFEGLLLQARASLDCLCLLVDQRLGTRHPGGDSFRKYPEFLKSKMPEPNSLASAISQVWDASEHWTGGVMTTVEGQRGLRDFVAHRGGLTMRTSACFGFTYVAKDRYLVIDCETNRVPIFRTTTEAVMHTSQIVLNTISCIAGISVLPIDSFSCVWLNRSIAISDFAIDEPEGSKIGQHSLAVCRRLTPVENVIQEHNVNPAVFEHALDPFAELPL